jgi:hypothetical protein
MTTLIWDEIDKRRFRSGVDRGVLYPPNDAPGVPWNGLASVEEAPSGGTITPRYIDGIRYLNTVSKEEFSGTIEAITYPDEFEVLDGITRDSFKIGYAHQPRHEFGFSYRVKIGNALNPDLGYEIHLIYNCTAEPSTRKNSSLNESPGVSNFSWKFETRPVFPLGQRPTAHLILDSTEIDPGVLALIEDIIYGTHETDPQLPDPNDLVAFLGGVPMPFLYVPYFYVIEAGEDASTWVFPDESVGGDAAYDVDTGDIYLNDEANTQVCLYPYMWDLTLLTDFPAEALLGDLGFDGTTGDVFRNTTGAVSDRLVPAKFRGTYTPTDTAPYPTSVEPGDGWLINGNVMVWLGTTWHDFGPAADLV